MEMMEMAAKVVEALKGDQSLLSAFSADPAKIVTTILGSGLSNDLIGKIIQEVTKQLGPLLGGDALKGAADAAADAAKNTAGGGILDKLKSLF